MDLFWRQLTSLLGPPGPTAAQQLWLPTPLVSERRMFLRSQQPLILSRLDALLSGGTNPNVSVMILHGPDASTAGTAVTLNPITINSANGGTTTGTVITNLQAPVVPVDHWLWLEVTAVSGSPAGLTVAVRFN